MWIKKGLASAGLEGRSIAWLICGSLLLAGCGDDDPAAPISSTTGSPPGAVCGNGAVEAGEQCDDGNSTSGDGCSPTCDSETASCGDGTIDPGEACDDGNGAPGDGCSPTCAVETGGCGDGTEDPGEECDDGNTRGGDGCSARCQEEVGPVCGDAAVDPGEECDDGNDVPFDGCEDDCSHSSETVSCATLPPLPSGTCEVTAGNAAKLITGRVLAPYTVFEGGQVLIDDAGDIACVGCDCSGVIAGATEIVCPTGVVSPGLINAHDHITYAHSSPYTDTGERYEHRHDWRVGKNGHTEIPASGGASQDRIRWGELRFLMGGATSTVGSGSATGFLRNLDKTDQEGLAQKPVHYDTFPLGDSSGLQLAAGCGYPDIATQSSIAMDDAYFPHISEGIDAFARNEFICASSTASGGEDILEPQSSFIHSIGLTPIEYGKMADQGTALVWSPRSNVTLYGDTAVVTVAARLGVEIALGTDWMPTGSMNMQRELQCADYLNQNHYDGFFTDRDLWRMATVGASRAAAMDDAIGALAVGLAGDVAIFEGGNADPHRAIIVAQPADIALVLRGGAALYGDGSSIDALGAGCDALDVCGAAKKLCAQADIGKSYAALVASVGSVYPSHFCGQPDNEPSCVPTRPVSVNGSTTYSGIATGNDPDGDGIETASDNCPAVFNPIRPVDDGLQGDFDGDGEGDACDPCPLQPNTTVCAPFDPSDVDADGHPNAADNCPDHPNPGQEDGDADDKGDACDPCPATANPGADACPVTIYAIKSGLATGQVALLDALVTGCKTGTGFFLQVKPTDAGFTGYDNSGVYVYHPAAMCTGAAPNVSVGDRVDVQPATVSDFFGQIQLVNATVSVKSSGEVTPAPLLISSAEAGGTVPTSLESVLVEVQDVLVSDASPPPGPGDATPTNEFEVDGILRVDDLLYLTSPLPIEGSAYTSLRGVLNYRNGFSKLEPRSAADLVAGPPVLLQFAPAATFAREGLTGPTIPEPLSVVVSAPVPSDTFVTIDSSAPGSLAVVGGGVLIPSGANSQIVDVDALLQHPGVDLTATLGAAMLSANVRVVGPAEVPVVLGIDPPSASVSPLGVVDFDVFLDIPAPPGGALVTLGVIGEGIVPASVTIGADQILGPFSYTAGASEMQNTVTATFGATVSATIDVAASTSLVINEVDYDQPSTDDMEFVELFNGSGGPIDLADLSLVFINGSGGMEYDRVDLAPAGVLANGQYLVVGSSALLATVPAGALTLPFGASENNIQNGAPDAVGLVDLSAGILLDALSYEGSVNGNVNGIGILPFVEGTPTAAADDGAVPGSLSRLPNGADTDDAMTDWSFVSTPTPGEAN